jgi:hypothetical protein
MRAILNGLAFLLLLLGVSLPVWSRSFPSTPDATEAEQQRWGTSMPGYVTDGCWARVPATGTTLTLEPCTAFALDTTTPPTLKGFTEPTARPLALSGGDGRYWIAGRISPGLSAPGWTCGDGVHYCWLKAETTPLLPTGLVLLLEASVAAGAVAPPVIIRAPWQRQTPYTVPAGVTLTFGVCPTVERAWLFDATETSTGTVRFLSGACERLYPEWWGADPFGLRDSSAAWQAAVNAGAGQSAAAVAEWELTPVACTGVYAISAPAGSRASTLTYNTQILGVARPAGGGNFTMPCRFDFRGAGTALGLVDINASYWRLRLENLQVFDVDDTGAYGLELHGFTASQLINVMVRRFDVSAYFGTNLYYSKVEQLRVFGSRRIGVDIAGVANGVPVSVQCNNTTNTTQQYCVRVGQTPGEYGSSSGLWLDVLSEISSGTAISIDRVRAINLQAYIELPGLNPDDYSDLGQVTLRRVEGGTMHIRMAGKGGTPPPVRYGIAFYAAPDEAGGFHNRNIVLTGHVRNYEVPLAIEIETGGWGIDYSGLAFDEGTLGAEVLGQYTSGWRLGRSYITHGGPPEVDQGRGSTLNNEQWLVGDLIWGTPAPEARLGNILRQVTVGGNPPVVAALHLPTLTYTHAAVDQGVPSLREGNTFFTRLIVEPDADTPITNFADGVLGLCVHLRAAGTRTIQHGTTIRLAGSADYVMSAGNTLLLCADGDGTGDPGTWREYGRCSTCVP